MVTSNFKHFFDKLHDDILDEIKESYVISDDLYEYGKKYKYSSYHITRKILMDYSKDGMYIHIQKIIEKHLYYSPVIVDVFEYFKRNSEKYSDDSFIPEPLNMSYFWMMFIPKKEMVEYMINSLRKHKLKRLLKQ